VLIVDDQKGVSRLLRSALETIEQGLVVSEAPSGEEAILEARRTRMDLLIADYLLPGINGVELMKKFRLINPQGKVIMISGVADPRMFRQVTEAAPEAFFAKPVPMSDFLEAVETCLGLTPSIIKPLEKVEPVISESQPVPLLSDLLIGLRKTLNAQGVLLINQKGQVAAQAGEFPALVNNENLVSALMGLLGAGNKAAGLIDHPDQQLHIFGGDDKDSIFLPVGENYTLLLVGKGLADVRLLSARLESIFAARQNLLKELIRIEHPQETLENGLKLAVPVPAENEPGVESPTRPQFESTNLPQNAAVDEPYTRPEDMPGDFLNIFDQLGAKTADVNRFWDDVVEKGTTYLEPDKLTYEQASRLGLTPDSAQDK
jgi:two-component system, response regulator, stage 0 sporulation protein F